MFEEEQDNKIYNLIITRGIDQENEYGQFTEKLYSKPDFLWTESMARDYAPFGESFFKKVDVIVILSGIYNYNQEPIDILIKKAEEFDIPILLVCPYGMEIVPEELEAKAKTVVGWNANCIVEDIRSIVNGDFDELCDDF
ncbi:nuclease [uncultured Methanobrevibacter sp.]|uniref:nuclease n=1 Tax=uncultured Methanobrevibacter sp. TaxID=253161 RepID=UPI0025F99926|nr:nuclease [uncultured Methanobrevibacter sp.]